METLKENIVILDEVAVSANKLIKNPNEIVRRAIENIEANSNNNSFGYNGYYRQIDEQDNSLRRVIEAGLYVNHSEGQSFIDIIELRKTKDHRIEYDNDQKKSYDESRKEDIANNSQNLKCWYNKHDYQHVANSFLSEEDVNFCGEFNNSRLTKSFHKEHKFKIDTITTYKEELVYQIKILPSAKSKPYYQYPKSLVVPIGKLYIRTSDFSMLRFEYNYILNPKKVNSSDFHLISNVLGSRIISQSVANYQEYNGKIYLSYLSSQDYLASNRKERLIRSKNSNRVYHLLKREFLVNEIIEDQDKLLKKKNPHSNLYDIQLPYNPQYWLHVNTIPETNELKNWREGAY